MERELIIRSKAGDRYAFSELVRKYYKRVFKTAYLILKNRQDAEDITQTVFLKAYSSITSFNESRSFFPWLHRITKNLSLNLIKRRKMADEKVKSMAYGEPSIDPLPALPEEMVLREEESRNILNALAELPTQMRDILILKHWKDCSYREISEILSIPIGTVMSRLYYARKKLAETIEETENRGEVRKNEM